LLQVLELERDRFAPTVGLAIRAARCRLIRLQRGQIRDRARAARHARWLASHRREDLDRLDVPWLLDQLSPRERQVVELKLWGGLSGEECAMKMGVTVNTVDQHYRHALARLRSLYDA
jgi:RNA polymerase sigma factor (sigma-70 family)